MPKILPSDCLLTALNRDALLSLLPKGGVGLEIGVNRGGYSRKILSQAEPRVLHLVDPWPVDKSDEYLTTYNVKDDMEENYQLVLKNLSTEISSGQVIVHRAYSNECAGSFSDAYFDFIYVDGMHTYEACHQDLKLYASKLKPTGFLMGHDFSNTTMGRLKKFGVIKAVKEFVAEGEFFPALVTLESAPSFVLMRHLASRQRLIEGALARAPGVLASFQAVTAMEQQTVVFGQGPKKLELIRV